MKPLTADPFAFASLIPDEPWATICINRWFLGAKGGQWTNLERFDTVAEARAKLAEYVADPFTERLQTIVGWWDVEDGPVEYRADIDLDGHVSFRQRVERPAKRTGYPQYVAVTPPAPVVAIDPGFELDRAA